MADRPKYLERLGSPADFARVQGEAGEVKYLGRVNGRRGLPPADKPCMFQDTASYPGHITFLKSFPELSHLDFQTYLDLVMKDASRVLWGGELKYFSTAVHPRTGRPGILAYFVYADDAATEALTVVQLAEVDAKLKECVPYAKTLLTLVGMNEIQARGFQTIAPDLAARGVDVIDPRLLRPGGGAEGYSLGEGYGFLRVIPRGQTADSYGPRDVLVAESTSEDLSLVAGLVTALPQNLHSHVNLRLREKMIPNASVPDIYDNPVVSLLDGKLVHITVSADAASIDPALLSVATAFWEAHRPPIALPVADLSTSTWKPFSMLRAADSTAFGGKAANLGELAFVLPAANAVPDGFGIPFSTYRDFMQTTGLQDRVEALLDDQNLQVDAAARELALASLRKQIEAAALDPVLLTRLVAAAQGSFGQDQATMPVRFRSSSNIEDGELVSGAGLHDSSRGCLADDLDGDEAGPSLCLAADERASMEAELARRTDEQALHPERTWLADIIADLHNDLTKERSAARALKKVYASLWNARASEERAYWGIDQRAAYMGIAVEPAFVLEKLDAVAVTNLDPGDGGPPLYRVVSQRDGQGVVRPADPTLVAETLTFRRGADDTATDVHWLTMSSLSTVPLWSDSQLAELAGLLFKVQDHFAAHVYTTRPSSSLDLEIKLTRDDRIVIKQARPYLQGAF